MEQLYLRRIKVDKLFNRFSYDIDLENGNDVAILIAPNGCGKTTIFELVSLCFNPEQYEIKDRLKKIPFEKITFCLSNGKEVSMLNMSTHLYVCIEYNGDFAYIDVDGLFEGIFSVDRIDSNGEFKNILYNACTGMGRLYEDLPFVYDEEFEEDENDDAFEFYRDFMRDNGCLLDIGYIVANRLFTFVQEGYFSESITEMQNNIKEEYDMSVSVYHTARSNAAVDLPQMYITHNKNATKRDKNDLIQAWREYCVKTQEYQRYLPLDNNIVDSFGLFDISNVQDDKLEFISVYLDLFSGTTYSLDKFINKFELLKKIFDERNLVTGKSLNINEKGEITVLVDGKKLLIESLSSGEKNDLLMFYSLIFEANAGKTVLIDEPEISLHIEWQERYLDDLIDICKINKMKAIVATHSPNIVNGHFELYAERGLINEG